MTGTDTARNSNKKKIIIACAAVAVVAIAAVCIIFARSGYLATTMRLLKAEGTVSIEDAKGGTKPVSDNLRFQSGEALNTGADGLASVGLDDAKIVTLDHDSRAEFTKKKKQLELKLTKGALFVNVAQKLKADEKFEIKTSTMTAGIRGTTIVVYQDKQDNNRDTLALLEGQTVVTATNPDTHETKSITLKAGQQVKVYLYSNRTEDSVEFFLKQLTEKDLTHFMYEMLNMYPGLVDQICNASGWNKGDLQNMLANLKNAGVDLDKPPVGKEPEKPEKPVNPEPQKPSEADPEQPGQNEPEANPPSTKKKVTKKTRKKTTKKTYKKTTTKKKKKTSSVPSVPSGWSKYSAGWNKTYGRRKIYIIHQHNEIYKGYISGRWVDLEYEWEDSDNDEYLVFYYGGKVFFKP